MITKETVGGTRYKVINGTYYHIDTPDELVTLLEHRRTDGTRMRFYFGDPETGVDWEESHDIVGYIGRSTGTAKIPLLLYNKRSLGGGALMTDKIVKIEEAKGKRVIWQNPKYHRKGG